jgi:hypothetical protein
VEVHMWLAEGAGLAAAGWTAEAAVPTGFITVAEYEWRATNDQRSTINDQRPTTDDERPLLNCSSIST